MSDDLGGPYIALAVFCEKALQEKDGVLSIIRVIDRLIVNTSGPAAPEQMPAAQLSFPLVIVLKSGFVNGKYNLKIVPNSPSGKILGDMNIGLLLEARIRMKLL
ncbi:MAG: hypothetical protein WBR26_18775 [Candidatus Acidiferrum sp.]